MQNSEFLEHDDFVQQRTSVFKTVSMNPSLGSFVESSSGPDFSQLEQHLFRLLYDNVERTDVGYVPMHPPWFPGHATKMNLVGYHYGETLPWWSDPERLASVEASAAHVLAPPVTPGEPSCSAARARKLLYRCSCTDQGKWKEHTCRH